jgi:hypothetical protein
VAEKNGWAFPLLSNVQGDAVRSDIVLLETVVAPKIFRFSHSTLQQACNNGGASHEQSAARQRWIFLIAAHDADFILPVVPFATGSILYDGS